MICDLAAAQGGELIILEHGGHKKRPGRNDICTGGRYTHHRGSDTGPGQ